MAKSGAFQKTRRSGVGDCYDIEAFAGYLDDRGLSPSAACERAAQVMTDQYDYALLKVSWINEGAVTNAPAVGSVPEIMERVYITQHPKGRPMHWCEGRRVDQYAGVDWPDFIVYHDCDTVRGASGAPVFKESGELIAIHVGTRGLTLATTVGDYEYLFTQDRLPKSVAVDVHDVLSLKTKL